MVIITVLQGDKLYARLDKLVSNIEQEIDGDKNSPHKYFTGFLNIEKQFLKKYDDSAQLSFSGNGFPSTESITEDYGEITNSTADLGPFVPDHVLENLDFSDYSSVPKDEVDRILEKKKLGKELVHLSFKETKEKAFQTTITKITYTKGIDDISENIPLTISKNILEYQIIWDDLFTKKSSEFYVHNTFLEINSIQINNKLQENKVYTNIEKEISLNSTHLDKIKIYDKRKNKIKYRSIQTNNEGVIASKNFITDKIFQFKDLIEYCLDEKVYDVQNQDINNINNVKGGSFVLASSSYHEIGRVISNRLDLGRLFSPMQEIKFEIISNVIKNDETYSKLNIGMNYLEKASSSRDLIDHVESQYKNKYLVQVNGSSQKIKQITISEVTRKMTVLQGDKLYARLDKLINSIENETKDQENSPHKHTINFLKSEKKFLEKTSDNPSLAFSGNGFPSVESITEDYNEIAKLNGELNPETTYLEENIDISDYSKVSPSKFENVLKEKQASKELINITFSETEDKAFNTKISSIFYANSFDETSASIPLLIKESNLEYQIIWGDLFTRSSEKYFIHNKFLNKNKEKAMIHPDRFIGNYKKEVTIKFKKLDKIKKFDKRKKVVKYKYPMNEKEVAAVIGKNKEKIFSKLISIIEHYTNLKIESSNARYKLYSEYSESIHIKTDRYTSLANIRFSNIKFFPLLVCKQKVSFELAYSAINDEVAYSKISKGLDYICSDKTTEEIIEKIENDYENKLNHKSIAKRLLGK